MPDREADRAARLILRRRACVASRQNAPPEQLTGESIMRSQNAVEAVIRMDSPTVLLRAVDGTQEGWRLMIWDDFLEQIDLSTWSAEQQLTGTVLPPLRQPTVG